MNGKAKAPIQVYLDSSDYSDLSNPRRPRSAEEQKVLDFVRDAQRRGAIQVRYSIIHMVEACHRDTPSKPMAQARAALIHELSGSHVLKALPEIIRNEFEHAEVAKRRSDLALDDLGRWYPTVGNLGARMRADMSSLPQDAATIAGGNRAARRAAKKAYGTPSKQYAFFQKFCKDGNGLATLCAKHGMPGRIAHDGLFSRIFDHQLSDQQVTDLLCGEIFHPQHFVEDYVDRFERDQVIRGSVRGLGDRLIDGVAVFRSALDRGRQAMNPALARELTGIRSMTQAQVDGFRETLIEAAMRGQSTGMPSHDMATSAHRSCAGIEVLVAFMESWFADLIGGVNAAGRTPKVSDAGDALHAFYLPYVDVWRGDRYACDVMRDKASEYGTEVVPRLGDLPGKLEFLIGRGGAASKMN